MMIENPSLSESWLANPERIANRLRELDARGVMELKPHERMLREVLIDELERLECRITYFGSDEWARIQRDASWKDGGDASVKGS